jgi:hypothetical protein
MNKGSPVLEDGPLDTCDQCFAAANLFSLLMPCDYSRMGWDQAGVQDLEPQAKYEIYSRLINAGLPVILLLSNLVPRVAKKAVEFPNCSTLTKTLGTLHPNRTKEKNTKISHLASWKLAHPL